MLRRAFLLCLAAGCSSFSSAPDPGDGGASTDAAIADAAVEPVLPDGAPVPEAALLVSLASLPLGLAASGTDVVVTQIDGIRLFHDGIEAAGWETVPIKEKIGGPVVFSDSQTVIFSTNDHLRTCATNVPICDQTSSDLKLPGQSLALAATSTRLAVGKAGVIVLCNLPGSCDGANGKASNLSGLAPIGLAFNAEFIFVAETNDIATAAIQPDRTLTTPGTIVTDGALSMTMTPFEVYWADRVGNLWACLSTTQKCPAPRLLAERRAGAKDLAIFERTLYWLEPSGAVYRCDPNACSPQAVVSAPAASHLALGKKIYLVNNSAIWSAPF